MNRRARRIARRWSAAVAFVALVALTGCRPHTDTAALGQLRLEPVLSMPPGATSFW